jgi:hypothetical protein
MLGNGVSGLRHEVMDGRGWLWVLSGSKISMLKQQIAMGFFGVAIHLMRPTRCNKLHRCSSSLKTHQPKPYNLVVEARHFMHTGNLARMPSHS